MINKKNNRTSAAQKRVRLQNERSKLLNPSSPFAVKEAYVQLRTNMLFSVAPTSSDSSKVFAVSSSNPKEGKSITASNIAISFAMMEKKTLLVDCDMRKPNVHRLWGLDSDKGMSNLLTSIDECIVHKVKNLPLDIITAGKIPPNPSELLSSAKFAQAVAKFRELYDIVIIDTPPVKEVADCSICAQHIDGIVFLVRAGATQTYEVKNALECLEQNASKICGILVNGADPKIEKYSYRSGYYKRGNYRKKGNKYGTYNYRNYMRGYGNYGNYGSGDDKTK
ncbi:MAG: CpsD/CapB family tyrosine-protein kinase [Clostridia bacterium]|nr:CpsD/CapB family tyrosine-protein kinase [Clostridia bacterium]